VSESELETKQGLAIITYRKAKANHEHLMAAIAGIGEELEGIGGILKTHPLNLSLLPNESLGQYKGLDGLLKELRDAQRALIHAGEAAHKLGVDPEK
jgi:hypothetical protein